MNETSQTSAGKPKVTHYREGIAEGTSEGNSEGNSGQNVQKRINTFVIDATNGKRVKSVYFVKKSKIGRDVPRMMWQYYRDRNKTDVNVVKIMFNRQKKEVHTMEIIYSGDPVIYKIPRTPLVSATKNNTVQSNAIQCE